MNRNLSVIIGFACCSFLLACGDDPSTGVEFSNGPEEPLESSSSAEIALSSSILAFVSSSSIVAEIPSSSSVVSVKPSSSSVASSSSSVRPVSSSAVEPPEESSSSSEEIVRSSSSSARLDPAYVVRDSMVDMRDGHVYKTVKIGEQVWMAENLRYAVDGESVCYENNEEYCAEFGRMYKGANPADSTADGTLQSYCPEGWRLPKRSEVDTLKVRTGSSFTTIKSASGWGESIGNGSDIYGFNILPGGSSYVRDDSLWFHDIGEDAIFWTSTYPTTYLVEAPEPYVFVIQAGDGSRIIDPRYYLYIRCIKE